MKLKMLSAAALFLAAAFSLQAQTVSSNDIIVGIRGSSATNLEIKAGSLSTLASYTSETLIGNFNSSLSSAIGANWATATTLSGGGASWGAGGSSGASTLVFASSLWDTSTAGTLGTANNLNQWNTLASVGAANTAFNSLFTGFNGVAATATGDGNSKTISASNTNSWSTKGGTSTSAFGTFNPNNNGFSGIVGNTLASGQTYSAIDLYSVGPNSSTFLGTFALYQNGNLTFTAVPEPSTYAAILGVMTLGVVMIRRRRASAQLADVA